MCLWAPATLFLLYAGSTIPQSQTIWEQLYKSSLIIFVHLIFSVLLLLLIRTSWQFYFRYAPKIFDRYTSAEGFLFLQDDTILNYWNLLQADKSKLWIANKVSTNMKSWFLVLTSCEWKVSTNCSCYRVTQFLLSMAQLKGIYCFMISSVTCTSCCYSKGV